MKIKILVLCLFSIFSFRNSDLKMFIKSINGHVIYVNNYHALYDQVKSETSNECPGLILIIFSGNGKRISTNVYSKYDLYKISRHQLKMVNTNIVCILIHKHLIIWE